MRHARLAVLAALMVLLAGAIVALAYEGAREDRIAPGTTVGGVDVGGMPAGEARALLSGKLDAVVQLPVTLVHGAGSW